MYATRPCLQVYKSIAKDLRKKKDFRQLYFLEAIAQGAMDLHTEMHLAFDPATHSVSCSQCGEAVAGESAWAHFVFDCPFTCTKPKLRESQECEQFLMHLERAKHETGLSEERADL